MTPRERSDSLTAQSLESSDAAGRSLAPSELGTRARADRDRAIAEELLPSSTDERAIASVTYWTFKIRCSLGSPYTMSAYFDGRRYQVRVLEPNVVDDFGRHDCHVDTSGRLDLGIGGAESLDEAFARATIWASRFSCLRETGVW